MTVTLDYSRTHAAFLEVAREEDIDAFDVRVLVALLEEFQAAGEQVAEVKLAEVLRQRREAVQRSTRKLRALHFIERHASGPRGSVMAWLLPNGVRVARLALERAGGDS